MAKRPRKVSVFVSYSRQDSSIIKPLVRLMQMSGAEVFLDIDSIRLGETCRDRLAVVIGASTVFLIFWCEQSSISEEVRKEWLIALRRKKTIVPVLLDGQPLHKRLARWNGLDFRGATNHSRPRSVNRVGGFALLGL